MEAPCFLRSSRIAHGMSPPESLPGAAAVEAGFWDSVTLELHSISNILQPGGKSGYVNPRFEVLLPEVAQ